MTGLDVTPTRRALLLAGGALGLAACTHAPAQQRPAAPDPDDALRAAAVTRERDLLARYDAAVAAAPAGRRAVLVAVRAEHAAHLQALGAAPATPAPSAAAGTAAALPAAERAAAAAHAAAALSASPALAGLLAQLAASEASHAVALA